MKKIIHLTVLAVLLGLGVYATFPDRIDAAASDADVPAVKAALQKVTDAIATKDLSVLKKTFSTKTVALFESAKDMPMPDWSKAITFVKATPAGDGMLIDATEVNSKGVAAPLQFMFVKEGGEWKLGLVEGMEYAFAQYDQAVKKETSPGFAVKGDLIITKVETSKNPTILNDNTEIKIYIKNRGTGTVSSAPATVKIFTTSKDYVTVTGGVLEPIKAGETVVWTAHPFSASTRANTFQPKTAGTKRIDVVVNSDKKVPEVNYKNNTFSKSVVFYKQK
ncbi:MAG: hypothetical protein RJB39_325 [Candidatus Parcubacteria bacterium]|jgi:hypothetical protein